MVKKPNHKKSKSPNTFENLESFENVIKPIIRVRGIHPAKNRKLNLVLTNLLVFIIFFVLSSILYVVSYGEFFDALFFLLSLIFGGLSIAFLIILLSLVFLRLFNK